MKALCKLLRGNRMALIGVTILGLFFCSRSPHHFLPLMSQTNARAIRTNTRFVVKAAKANPDGWIAETLATDRRTLAMSKS